MGREDHHRVHLPLHISHDVLRLIGGMMVQRDGQLHLTRMPGKEAVEHFDTYRRPLCGDPDDGAIGVELFDGEYPCPVLHLLLPPRRIEFLGHCVARGGIYAELLVRLHFRARDAEGHMSFMTVAGIGIVLQVSRCEGLHPYLAELAGQVGCRDGVALVGGSAAVHRRRREVADDAPGVCLVLGREGIEN